MSESSARSPSARLAVMRLATPLLLGRFLGTVTHAAAANDTSCSSSLQIFVARGTGEPLGTGKMGMTAMAVAGALPASITPISYPAVAVDYFESVANGTAVVLDLIRGYAQRCPTGRMVLMGYSQGGQAIMDALCGTSSAGFQAQPGLGGAFVDNLVAVIIFGDPSHRANVTYNYGTSQRNGLFPRVNETGCAPYASRIRSYCDTGDVYCDLGNNRATHSLYVEAYTQNVVEFVLNKTQKNPGSGSGSATPSPTPTPRNAAQGMSVGHITYAVAGVAALLSVW